MLAGDDVILVPFRLPDLLSVRTTERRLGTAAVASAMPADSRGIRRGFGVRPYPVWVIPPSTTSDSPLTYPALSEARYRAASATSCGAPNRPDGMASL